MDEKKRTYSLRLVKEDYTYSLEQIADLFRISTATIRRWIKNEGLNRVPKARPYLIHSSELKAFLEKRQQSRKQPCKKNEAPCFKCRGPQIPKVNSGKIFRLPNGSIRFQADCSICNSKVNKVIKGADWDKNHPMAAYLQDATQQHLMVRTFHKLNVHFRRKERYVRIQPL